MSISSELRTRQGLLGPVLDTVSGPLLLLLAIAGGVTVYWSGLTHLAEAWQQPEYSHGPIIPLLSSYMFLREMRTVRPVPRAAVTDRAAGIAVVAVAVAIGVLGSYMQIPDIVVYAFVVWVGGMILTMFGLRRGWIFWPSVLHLVFMLPLPFFVYWQISTGLMRISSVIGTDVISALGIPVLLDGNVIDLGTYKLQVAEACSGLRYLFPIMSFSYVFGVLYTGPRWHKIALFASAAPIAVLMNSLRVAAIGVLVDSYGIGQAEGFLHLFEGWVVFILCILVLFAEARIMQRLGGDRRPLGEALDLTFDNVWPQLTRFAALRPTKELAIVAAMLVGIVATSSLMPTIPPAETDRRSFVSFPDRVGDWRGTTETLDPAVENVLRADDYLASLYQAPDEQVPVDFFAAYYVKLAQGPGIHTPNVCLPNAGWEVSGWQTRTVDAGAGAPLEVNRAVIQKGMERAIVYFWFQIRGKRFTNPYVVKLSNVWDAITQGRTDGGIVRVITAIPPGGTEAAADARLSRFLKVVLPTLPAYMPD